LNQILQNHLNKIEDVEIKNRCWDSVPILASICENDFVSHNQDSEEDKIQQNDFISKFSVEDIKENVGFLIYHIVEIFCKEQSRIFIFEDAQWLDNESWTLINDILDIDNILVLVCSRLSSDADENIFNLFSNSKLIEIKLQPLSNSDISEIIKDKWNLKKITPIVEKRIIDQAKGNPLFACEIFQSFLDSKCIEINSEFLLVEKEDVSKIVLPQSLNMIFTAHLDKMNPIHSMILKVASILGKKFDLSALESIYKSETHTDISIKDQLEELIKMGILINLHNFNYEFSSILFQEVLVNMMLLSQRRRLHRSVANYYISQETKEKPLSERHLLLIIFHLERAGRDTTKYQQSLSDLNQAHAILRNIDQSKEKNSMKRAISDWASNETPLSSKKTGNPIVTISKKNKNTLTQFNVGKKFLNPKEDIGEQTTKKLKRN